jgi:hypothetical protein
MIFATSQNGKVSARQSKKAIQMSVPPPVQLEGRPVERV